MEELINYFQRLGLTQYESTALAALISRHDSDAQQIAEIAEIPYTKIYSVLTSLEKQGFLKTTLERPKKYRPLTPEGIINLLLQKRKQELEYFQKRSEEGLELVQKIYTTGERFEQEGNVIYLPTRDAVWDMVREFIRTFKKSIYTMGTVGSWEYIFDEKWVAKEANKYVTKGKFLKQVLPNSINIASKIPKTTFDHLKFLVNPLNETRFYSFSDAQPNILICDEETVMTGFINPETNELSGGLILKDKSNINGYIDYFNMIWRDATPLSNLLINQIKEKLKGK